MSWQASKYARAELTAGVELRQGTRTVFLLLAEAAGSRTAIAKGGAWLATCAGLTEGSVRRAIHELAAAGLVAVSSNPPAPLIVRFPLAAALSTTRAPVTGYEAADPRTTRTQPAHHGAGTRAPVRAVPHRTGDVPQRAACELCDGVGYTYVDDRHVLPCSNGCAA